MNSCLFSKHRKVHYLLIRVACVKRCVAGCCRPCGLQQGRLQQVWRCLWRVRQAKLESAACHAVICLVYFPTSCPPQLYELKKGARDTLNSMGAER
jgi:hypothetical protein